MKKNLALLHMRENLLPTDYSVSTHKTARLGRRRPESTEVNQSIGAQIAQLKENLIKDLKIDTVEVKIIAKGTISRALVVKGVKVTKGAQIAIETAGGRVEA